MDMISRVKKPQQARSRESLERVLEAGLLTLVEDGWHDFTLGRVCERAGVTVGMLYRRFSSREELLLALQSRWIDDSVAIFEDLKSSTLDWSAMTARQAVRAAIDGIAGGFQRHEWQIRLFGLHGAFDDAGLVRLGQISRDYAAWYREGLMIHKASMTHPDPGRAIDFSFRLVLDTMIRRATHGDDYDTGTSFGDWDTFAAELGVVCFGYLFPPPIV